MNLFQHKCRWLVISFFFLLILVALIWRMLDLTVLHRSFLQGQGNARSLRVIDIPAYRGMIVDREGVPLAISTPVQSLWVNPKTLVLTQKKTRDLAGLLSLKPKDLMQKLKQAQNREFLYLKRRLTPMQAKKIADLKIQGLYFQQEYQRFYPEADSMAQLLGFTNIDDDGIEGLELAYQDWLMGESGKKRVVKDRMGRVIRDLGITKQPRPGHLLQLSIDRRIQFFAYHELKAVVDHFGAKFGSVVVLDTTQGEILAVANYPSFNPNIRSRYPLDRYRNKAITDLFEPGSVMKPFSIASALESGGFTPKTIIDTRPSWMIVHGHTIRDVHNYGVLDVTGVLQHSSNVGVSKMVLTRPADDLINVLMKAGIGQRTESGYPGEADGTLVNVADANPFVLATLAFGYGMSVNALQLAKSYLIFANQGMLLPITLIHNQYEQTTTRVIQPAVAQQMLTMMEAVVSGGTGVSASVSGYRVAGKTGTARIAGKKGYDAHRYIGSFVGLAPVSKPRLIVAVVIHEPTRSGYYGAAVAAPLFSKVMEASLRILDIPPDKET